MHSSAHHRGRRTHAIISFVAGCVAILAVASCRDVTPPNSSSPSVGRVAHSLNPPGNTTVAPGAMHGWIFYDDQHDSTCTDGSVCRMVTGPTGVASSAGSLELATNAGSDGKALVLPDYSATRFDQISELSYATYRQTPDAGNNLAITLQFNIDYDLNDASTGYQGRMVFEPYQGAGGIVPQATWQTWDARAGKWWGTKSSVFVHGVAATNPCVQGSPCTWPQLLATFPDIGIHGTYGAVVLKAGSGWSTPFRGNVDRFTIGIGGANTTFDFEPFSSAPPVHLHSEIGRGIGGPHVPADSDFVSGAVVHYDFSAAAGYGNLLVVVDDTLAAPSGDVVMTAPHTIMAGADQVFDGNVAVTSMSGRVSALMTAPDPASAYSDFLQWYLDRARVIGADSAEAELAVATFRTVDPYRDHDALVALDDALAGNVFVIDHFGGRDYTYYYLADDYLAATTGPVRPAMLRRRHGRHFVPQAILDRKPGARITSLRSPGSQRTAFSIASGAPYSEEFTEIIYVNGIFTPERDPNPNHASAAASADRLKGLVFSMPQFQDPTDPTSNSLVEVNYFWNKNLAGDLAAYDQAHRCVADEERNSRFRSHLSAVFDYARCKGMHFVLSLVENDIMQSVYEFITLRAHVQPPAIGDVNRLADLVKTYHTSYDAHVITVTHSQGNMVLAQALQQLPGKEGRPLQSQYCTGELSLAAPIHAADFGMDAHYLRGVDFNGDILGVIGLPNDFPHIDDDSSRAAAADLASVVGSLPLVSQYKRVHWGGIIHGVDYNYFSSPEGTASVKANLSELYDECMTGSIIPSSAAVTVPLGDSVKLGFTVLSRAGHILRGRVLRGGGVHSAINSDSFVVALGPTPSEAAPIMIAPWPTTALGTLTVTVPSIPFPGHIVEHRTSLWAETGGFSDNTSASGIPPAPTSSPGWDGTPGGCSATTTTTAGNAWTSWGQRCTRTFVLEIPADPLPGGTRIRVLYSDYPSGPFHGNPTSSLLPPHVAIADTLPYHCGQDYCLGAAILESRTQYNLIVKSDTTCFSDACGAASNRVPGVQPRLAPAGSRAAGGIKRGGKL